MGQMGQPGAQLLPAKTSVGFRPAAFRPALPTGGQQEDRAHGGKRENEPGGVCVQRPEQQHHDHGRAQQRQGLRLSIPALRQKPQQEHDRRTKTGGGKAGQPAISQQEQGQQHKPGFSSRPETAEERQQRRRQNAHVQAGHRRDVGDAQRPKGGGLIFAHGFLVVKEHRGSNARFLAHDPGQGSVQTAPQPARHILRTGALRGVSYLHALGNGDAEGHSVFQHPLAEVEPGSAAFAVGLVDPPLKAQLRSVVQLRRLLSLVIQGAVGPAGKAFTIQPNIRQGKGQAFVRTLLWFAVNEPGNLPIRSRRRRGGRQTGRRPQQPQRRRAQHGSGEALSPAKARKQKQPHARQSQRPRPCARLEKRRGKTARPEGRAQRQHPAIALHGRDAKRPHGVSFCT